MQGEEAKKCIEIIARRIPLTLEETRLLNLIMNDIRLEFELEGAVHPSLIDGSEGKPPEDWCW